MQFLSIFRQNLWIEMLKRVNKERGCCPVGLVKREMLFLKTKMFRIDDEEFKFFKIVQFSPFLFTFCPIFARLRGLER